MDIPVCYFRHSHTHSHRWWLHLQRALPPLEPLQSFYWLQKASEIRHSNNSSAPQAREAFFFFFLSHEIPFIFSRA